MRRGNWLAAALLMLSLTGCHALHTSGAANQQNEHQQRHHGDIDGIKLRQWVLPNFNKTMQTTDQLVADASNHSQVPASLGDDLDDYSHEREAVIDYFEDYRGHNITVGTAAVYDCDELVTVAQDVDRASRHHESLKVPLQQYTTARQALLTDEATINRLSNYS